jgi:hypothetical protein
VGYMQPWFDAMCAMHHRFSGTNQGFSITSSSQAPRLATFQPIPRQLGSLPWNKVLLAVLSSELKSYGAGRLQFHHVRQGCGLPAFPGNLTATNT